MVGAAPAADLPGMSELPNKLEEEVSPRVPEAPLDPPRSQRLARLLLVPALPPIRSPRERVEDVLGRELAGFLISALAKNQGRLGSSSP
jgi:hypothetical protein